MFPYRFSSGDDRRRSRDINSPERSVGEISSAASRDFYVAEATVDDLEYEESEGEDVPDLHELEFVCPPCSYDRNLEASEFQPVKYINQSAPTASKPDLVPAEVVDKAQYELERSQWESARLLLEEELGRERDIRLDAQRAVEDLRQQLQETQYQLEQEKKARQNADAMKQAIEKSNITLQEALNEQLQRLEEERNRVHESIGELDKMRVLKHRQTEAWMQERDTMKQELSRLANRVDELESSQTRLQHDKRDLEDSARQLRADLIAEKGFHAATSRAHQQSMVDLEALRVKVDELSQFNSGLRAQIDKLTDESTRSSQRHDQEKKALIDDYSKQKSILIEDFHNELQGTKSILQREQNNSNRIQSRIDELIQKLDSAELLILDLQRHNDALKTSMSTQDRTTRELIREFRGVKEKYESTIRDLELKLTSVQGVTWQAVSDHVSLNQLSNDQLFEDKVSALELVQTSYLHRTREAPSFGIESTVESGHEPIHMTPISPEHTHPVGLFLSGPLAMQERMMTCSACRLAASVHLKTTVKRSVLLEAQYIHESIQRQEETRLRLETEDVLRKERDRIDAELLRSSIAKWQQDLEL
eukprot:GILK01012609.1.p1 GENE.GILK01012609.1~~GILK01012609.1.p1  ORF type:complete len:592 (+),score=148.84 GILK01012609.1:2-1777(+)